MADITTVGEENPSPTQDDLQQAAGNGAADNRGPKRSRMSAEDEDDDDDKPGRERRKIEIKFIQDKSRRHITFSKRKAGIMKKAYELSVLTGTQVLLLVVSETGLVYTFTTPKLQPLVTKAEGKNLIQACLNAPDPATNENGVEAPEVPAETPEDVNHASVNPQQSNIPRPGGIHPGYMTNEQQQQMAYYQGLQQQQQAGGQYPGMPVGNRMPPQHQPTA
ncbi:transcription factor of morphogenesis MCM1 [Aspergillus udagawae]|jgi:MADS-box transcription factor|uniref:Transcription factor of morphogenesis MCM1 n=1 Tax=Aspergillus udagawae TaxID=91492 RepID=A0A8E0QU72_9EURO|nr:transcription factor of the MADS box [Aspergillus udagawae]GFF24635.1 transcription factor of morphogenesis MCM1 [Aspergillus udagawae]GFF36457.1 transcription factor of morphogenesis MCM1 [Aspergillus udagawae]GFF89196.1 transcription factor of morphogenesis MCM1 [Aspergillus udagawae]GFG11868.1 transcription factor of morphogenesis MCM1 [Aspergillus udagawae]GIC88838.1 transcription factor of the MADS box [Aspergillus udagawae]